MAGRGTDIKLGPGVAEAGGLHIVGTERHESPPYRSWLPVAAQADRAIQDRRESLLYHLKTDLCVCSAPTEFRRHAASGY